MLRLGSKYLMDDLRYDAIDRLMEYFPSNLDAFQRFRTTAADEDAYDSVATFSEESMQMEMKDVIAVINKIGRAHV